MNATNRIMNRALLALGGVILAAAGLAAVIGTVRPEWAAGSYATVTGWAERALAAADAPAFAVPGDPPVFVIAALALAVVVTVLLVAFLLTRHRGRTATVVTATTPGGTVTVDGSVAEAVLAGPLRRRRDVLAAHLRAYRVRGVAAIRLSITVRRGADLAQALAAAENAVAAWDALAGARVPVLIHLTDRTWRDALRSGIRAQ